MKIGTLILASGFVMGAATFANAQSAPATTDPVSDLQNQFGAIVGDAFRRPDPIINANSGPGSPARAAGEALRTSLQVPGAVFAGIMQPLVAVDQAEAPAAAPPPAPRHRLHARLHHHRVAAQG